MPFFALLPVSDYNGDKMNEYYPKFYYTSQCLMSSCPDTCCAKWEIVLNDTDVSFLQSHTMYGKSGADFVMTDSDGDRCLKLNNRRCPFLNDRNLCDLRLAYSYENTPEVCRLHPLFVEEYDGFTEKCPSLSCPAVAREVYNSDFCADEYPTPVYNGDDSLMSALIASRSFLLSTDFSDYDIDTLLNGLLHLSLFVTDNDCSHCTSDDYKKAFAEHKNEFENIKKYLPEIRQSILTESEILEGDWQNALSAPEKTDEKPIDKNQVIAFIRYLIYRYWLKGINFSDGYITALFISLSVKLCVDLAADSYLTFFEITRLFSKETEHNSYNSDLIFNFICDII